MFSNIIRVLDATLYYSQLVLGTISWQSQFISTFLMPNLSWLQHVIYRLMTKTKEQTVKKALIKHYNNWLIHKNITSPILVIIICVSDTQIADSILKDSITCLSKRCFSQFMDEMCLNNSNVYLLTYIHCICNICFNKKTLLLLLLTYPFYSSMLQLQVMFQSAGKGKINSYK